MPDITEAEVWRLLSRLRDDFRGRNTKWEDRRNVRYRRMDNELRSLPLNPRISDKALLLQQSEMPNQEAHRRTKRLAANPPLYEVILFEGGPIEEALAQELEDGIKGLGKWMDRGKVPPTFLAAQFQQGDGMGILKVDFLPGHGSSLVAFELDDLTSEANGDLSEEAQKARKRFQEAVTKHNGDESKAYDEVTDHALRTELPPFRMSAPDPLACAWHEDADGITVIAEWGQKTLNPLLEAFTEYGLRYSKENHQFEVDKDGSGALSSITIPPDSTPTGVDLGSLVEYAEIRTRDKIIILIEHPKIKDKSPRKNAKASDRGVVFTFDNPFGPFTTGYELIPGDVTTESDPADQYQPPILGTLVTTQKQNVLGTARLSAAMEEALAPAYIEVPPGEGQNIPPSDESKVKTAKDAREIPVIPGKLRRAEGSNIDLDKAEATLAAEAEGFRLQEAVLGDATSDASGHRLAIQVAQADIQVAPYQYARKTALENLMKGIVYAVKKHGLPIYIPTIPDGERGESGIRKVELRKISPEMAGLAFDLIVTLGADTAVTRYARWAALQERMDNGTLSYESLMEQSDVQDVKREIERVMTGKALIGTMEQLLPMIIEAALLSGKSKIQQFKQAQEQAAQEAMAMGATPESGLANGGGAPPLRMSDVVRQPGVNQGAAGPVVNVDGQRVQEGAGEMRTR